MNGWIEYFKGSDLVKVVPILDYVIIDKKFKEKKEDRMSQQGFNKGNVQNALQNCTTTFMSAYDQQIESKDLEISRLTSLITQIQANQSPALVAQEQIAALNARVQADREKFISISQRLAAIQTELSTLSSTPTPVINSTPAAAPALTQAVVSPNAGGTQLVTAAKPHKQGVTYRIRKPF